MGVVAKAYEFVAAAIPTAANWNANPDAILSELDGNLDAANVDEAGVDGIVTKNSTQTITGAKTFSAAATLGSTLAVTGASTFTGDVGIGVSPSYLLHLKDVVGNAVLGLEATGGDTFQLISHGTGTALAVSNFSLYDTSSAAHRIVVDNNGFVGVKVTDPAATLNVGLGTATGAPTLSSDTVAVFEHTDAAGDDVNVSLISGASGVSKLVFGDTTTEAMGALAYNNSTNAMTLVSNTTTMWTIDSNGDWAWLPDTVVTASIGRFKINNDIGTFNDYAVFGHYDQCSSIYNYGFAQDDLGATFVNAPTGQTVQALINGTAELTVAAGAVTINNATDDLALVDAGTAGATNDGWIEITIAGATQYIRTHTTI